MSDSVNTKLPQIADRSSLLGSEVIFSKIFLDFLFFILNIIPDPPRPDARCGKGDSKGLYYKYIDIRLFIIIPTTRVHDQVPGTGCCIVRYMLA